MTQKAERAGRIFFFFGLPDGERETWAQSEKAVLDVCREKLGIQLSTAAIERAHRLGRFSHQKHRPIIVKMVYKEKETVLSNAFKLKGTPFSVSQDYIPSVRLARRKLIEFARSHGKPIKLRFDKLLVDNKCYIYAPGTDSVRELNPPERNLEPDGTPSGLHDPVMVLRKTGSSNLAPALS